MEEKFVQEFNRLCDKASLVWPGFRRPKLTFNLTGQTAGMAHYSPRNEIRLNRAFCVSHPKSMLEDTLPHEVAHILVEQRYGPRSQPHGARWYAMFGALTGNAPEGRCHDYRADASYEAEAALKELTNL